MKSDVTLGVLGNGIAYSDALVQKILDREADSEIVTAQKDADFNVMTMEPLDSESKKAFLSYLGGDSTPFMAYLYPIDFESKEAVLQYLDAYNEGKDKEDTIVYTCLLYTSRCV